MAVALWHHQLTVPRYRRPAAAVSPLPTPATNSPTLSTSSFAHLQDGPVGGDAMQDFSDPPYIIYKKRKRKRPPRGVSYTPTQKM